MSEIVGQVLCLSPDHGVLIPPNPASVISPENTRR